MACEQQANGFRSLLKNFAENKQTVVVLTPLTEPITGKIVDIADDYLSLNIVSISDEGDTKFSTLFIPLTLIGGIEVTDSIHNEGEDNEIYDSLPAGRRDIDSDNGTASTGLDRDQTGQGTNDPGLRGSNRTRSRDTDEIRNSI